MGKPFGFMEYSRKDNETIDALDRIQNFNEFHKFMPEEKRKEQAARCMNCGVPYCQSAIELKGMVNGCPLNNLIPEWNDLLYKGSYQMALARLFKTNPFPEFTGRVCPALCEKACLNGLNDKPVSSHENELFIIEKAYEEGWVKPRIPTLRSDKKVAVIGAGPAGLALAYTLNQRGHNVTVYEKEDAIGGLLMYGIPNMKLDKKVIVRREAILKEEGIQFVYNCEAGKDISKEELLEQYDAIALCCGAKQPRALFAKGNDATGIYYAVDFLTQSTKHLLYKTDCVSAKDKNVIIVGGGDTGNDCVGTCIRMGCKSVTQLEMMPCPPKERAENNPWPEWPKVLKVDYGQKESIAVLGKDPRVYETTIKECLKNEEGQICGVVTVKTAFENGKMIFVEGSEKTLDCDLLLIAAGFTGVTNELKDSFDLKTTNRNVIDTNDFQTENEKIFAAGDCRRGQSLVVWAISEGKRCAREIDQYLMGYTNIIF